MSVDDMVGTVFDELERLGEDDTLAVFMSDNGLLWGEHHIGDSKRFPYEGFRRCPPLDPVARSRRGGHARRATRRQHRCGADDQGGGGRSGVATICGPTGDRSCRRSHIGGSCSNTGGVPIRQGVPSWRGLLRRGMAVRRVARRRRCDHVPRVLRPAPRPVPAAEPARRREPPERSRRHRALEEPGSPLDVPNADLSVTHTRRECRRTPYASATSVAILAGSDQVGTLSRIIGASSRT